MSFFSNYRGNIRFFLKGYLFLGAALLIAGVFVYSNRVITRMQEQSEAQTRIFSRFMAEVVLDANQQGKQALLLEVVREIKLPVILTDADGRPLLWHRIGVRSPADDEYAILTTLDVNNPPPGIFADVIALSKQFDRTNDPVPVTAGGMVQMYVHFGSSHLQRELRLMPLIQAGLFLLFMAVGLQGFRYLKLSEQRSIWVGMAKETAHQLGTPLSALLGWTQLLQDQIASGQSVDAAESIDEMNEDLKRLSKVTERFSKIGSRPELKNINITPVLERTVQYFHRRLPRLKADSAISLEFEETPFIRGNEELLEWVFENLIKNGLDAMGDSGGSIEVRTKYDAGRNTVDTYVRDTGKGVPQALRARIFNPGFTTKQRGWGLGLALTKRIVHDYHGGEIRVVESQPGKGTTFLVRFPAV